MATAKSLQYDSKSGLSNLDPGSPDIKYCHIHSLLQAIVNGADAAGRQNEARQDVWFWPFICRHLHQNHLHSPNNTHRQMIIDPPTRGPGGSRTPEPAKRQSRNREALLGPPGSVALTSGPVLPGGNVSVELISLIRSGSRDETSTVTSWSDATCRTIGTACEQQRRDAVQQL